MNRSAELCQFLELAAVNNPVYEPQNRHEALHNFIEDMLRLYNPANVLKLGVGQGELLHEIMSMTPGRVVVVDPSLTVIENFKKNHSAENYWDRLYLVQGEFNRLPIDFFIVEMVIAVDIMNVIDSSRCMDEVKRALNFENVFIYGDVILNDDDIDGNFDDIIRMISPLHNDFYLEGDLDTFMKLKDFRLVKSSRSITKQNFIKQLEFWRQLHDEVASIEELKAFYQAHKSDLDKFYNISSDFTYDEHYLLAAFMKNKYEELK